MAAHARRALGLVLVLAALASPALADKSDKHDKQGWQGLQGWEDRHGHRDKDGKHGHQPPPIGVPEIDPGSVLGGLTLLVGGTFILADRRRLTKPQLGAD
jgi:hypothetical protein